MQKGDDVVYLVSFKNRLWLFSFICALLINFILLFLINKERLDSFLKDMVNSKDVFDILFVDEAVQTKEEEKGLLIAGSFDGVDAYNTAPIFAETVNQPAIAAVQSDTFSGAKAIDDSQLSVPKVENESNSKPEMAVFDSTEQRDGTDINPMHEDILNDRKRFGTDLMVSENEKKTLASPTLTAKKRVTHKKVTRHKILSELTKAALVQLSSHVGNGHINEMGNPAKGPSDFQLLRERYWSDVERIWQQVCRATGMPAFAGNSVSSVVIKLTFFENGCLKNIKLHRSSGRSTVDEYIIKTFSEAHNQFPPIPERVRQHDGLERICTVYFYPDRTDF